jgi:hypothetical protein
MNGNSGTLDSTSLLLAMYCDEIMHKEYPNNKNKEILQEIKQTKVELIISVFRYLHAKDTFEAHYRRFLSSRLINKKSESFDQE